MGVVLPFRRTFVSGVTVSGVMVAPGTYALPQRLALVTSTLNEVAEALSTVPFSTTVTFGLHVGPVGKGFPVVAELPGDAGLPFPDGGAAIAAEALRTRTEMKGPVR